MPQMQHVKHHFFSKTFIFLGFIFFLLVGFYFGLKQGTKLSFYSASDKSQRLMEKAQRSVCPATTFLKNDYLVSYTVKPGDTLLSIAKSQLGSAARVNEIIDLNKNKYAVSLQTPFIEQGWILTLPAPFITHSSGYIIRESGELFEIDKTTNNWTFGGKAGITFGLHTTSGTRTLIQQPVKVGDCLTLVYDQRTNEIFLIEK